MRRAILSARQDRGGPHARVTRQGPGTMAKGGPGGKKEKEREREEQATFTYLHRRVMASRALSVMHLSPRPGLTSLRNFPGETFLAVAYLLPF